MSPPVYFIYAQIGHDERLLPDPGIINRQLCSPCTTLTSLAEKIEARKNPALGDDYAFLVSAKPIKYAPSDTFWERVRGLQRVEYLAGYWTLWEEEALPVAVANTETSHISVFVVPQAQYDKLNEERDKVSELRRVAFETRDEKAPSTEADPKNFRKIVDTEKLTFAFGRQMNASLRLLPVSLFQPEFGQFQDDIRTGPVDLHLQPLAWRFCRELEAMFDKEADRESCLHELLSELFGAKVAKQKIGKYETGGGIQDAPFKSHPAVPLLIEVKVETTIGTADAVFENLLYYEKAVRFVLDSKDTQTFRDLRQSRLASILIVHNGPNFQVSGGIWTSRGQVDVLSPAMSVDFNSLDIRAKVDWLRFLTALRRLFRSMRAVYGDLRQHAVASSQLEFPYPREYIPNAGGVSAHQQQGPVAFRYVKRVSQVRLVFTACTGGGGEGHAGTDEAKTDETAESDIVVKFVTNDRYGAEAHLAAASAGLAPELLSCTPLPGALRMVVMKPLPAGFVACSDLKTVPAGAREVINKTVARLHKLGSGYVHGDLRATNVFVRDAEDGSWECQLIDFDWAGPVAGKGVEYPIGVYISGTGAVWRPRQVMVGKITVEDDLSTVKNFLDESCRK